ncbi:cob(I)yrinic acid a,c-diamide adenosyltransferase [Collinsella aerofaciens]|uniref:cob(I)yrinic acid a,c-diamide adenosyltransferase n=1 Tax=Collinsella aerofaciens TaxID=74426 RepID=UPI0030CA1ED4
MYTGDGKGKTKAALGLALRATGYGLNVLRLQSAKKLHCAEHDAAPRLGLRTVQADHDTPEACYPSPTLPT